MSAAAGGGWTWQHALVPAGVQAAEIHAAWVVTLVVCTVVGAAVFIVFVAALWRAPRGTGSSEPIAVRTDTDARLTRVVVGATLVSIAGLFALVVVSALANRAIAGMPLDDALNIEVVGHQWWWEVRYQDAEPSRTFVTANELHIPVGRPVMIRLSAADVIHSFWVPRLHGKRDLIPGRINTIRLRADEPGEYRGQCAEFCGYQHAHMAFVVVARPRDEYERWAEAQRAPAREPAGTREARGRAVFLGTTCVMCHAIKGTDANALFGPDLTHVGSRRTLAAGRLPNDPEALARWITDPHAVKPGVNMPAHRLREDDLDALVAYLSSLR
jgi:cytochrome c oxidase subunit 2